MRTRITVAFVAILAVALLLSGGVSLLLVRHAVSLDAQHTVLRQAKAIESAVKNPSTGALVASSEGLHLIDSLADLTPETFVVGANGELSPTPAPGSLAAAINGKELLEGQPSAGVHDHVAFAAVPLVSYKSTIVAIVFLSKESFSADSFWYFLLASGLSLLGAAVLASVISARVASRVTAVADASQRIASGDLSARVPLGDATYPELVRLDTAVNTMAENLEQSRASERDFLLSVSHDLRTPLTSIRGYAEAIADGAVADLGAAAGVLTAESGRLDRLIGDLLDLARLRTKQFSLQPIVFDLADSTRLSAEAFRFEFDAAGVELVVTDVEHPVLVYGDPDRIGQVVANLTENALKFAAGRVEVGVAVHADGLAEVSVTDDGPGIATADLPHVFDRLYTNPRDVARSVGTGLGLAIVTELAAAMGGEIMVESPVEADHGTRFGLRVPLAAVGAQVDAVG